MLTYLIDDEAISLFVTEQMLRMEGITSVIRMFSGAEEALRFLLAHQATEVPEVILLDLNMPLVNGWDFLDALAPHAPALAGRCRIYVLTSSLALADTSQAKSYALVTGVIHKPLAEEDVQRIWHTAGQPHAVSES